ncbi:SMI1/KNR4 family protein [Tahibacter caeni]|uniref:SMI1/KNR4 family protein n=1 Tax=Tahibacter caeni TaxID=1453545 RepID=UPI0027D1F8DB|nr:SMI1/KNR4 family protein [Tahibacter caeni]
MMASLSELERIVLDRRPDLARTAPGPATEQDLALLRSKIGEIPASLRELLSWRNGSPSDSWFGDGFWYLLPSSEIGSLYSEWASRRSNRVHRVDGESNEVRGWPSSWVPFATWNGDVFVVLDGRDAEAPAVLGIDFEAGKIKRLASSFDAFIGMVLERVGENEELDVDELME